jgi:hypothetical protein
MDHLARAQAAAAAPVHQDARLLPNQAACGRITSAGAALAGSAAPAAWGGRAAGEADGGPARGASCRLQRTKRASRTTRLSHYPAKGVATPRAPATPCPMPLRPRAWAADRQTGRRAKNPAPLLQPRHSAHLGASPRPSLPGECRACAHNAPGVCRRCARYGVRGAGSFGGSCPHGQLNMTPESSAP